MSKKDRNTKRLKRLITALDRGWITRDEALVMLGGEADE